MMDSLVAAITDGTGWPRPISALPVLIVGLLISYPLSSNAGWVLFDMIDHYISAYVIPGVGLL